MQHIKLDAIDSTNDFLKQMARQNDLENYTLVTAEYQTKGKGQMSAKWNSKKGKNLLMSILVRDFLQSISHNYEVTIVFCLTVIDVLQAVEIPNLSIKWPNDIMSYQKKIGGILIENIVKSDKNVQSVIGFGLNVNQTTFENLPKAASLKSICKQDFDKDLIAKQIVSQLSVHIEDFKINPDLYWKRYADLLFKKNIPTVFQDKQSKKFMGVILGVSKAGKLKMQLEDETIVDFENKEIEMLFS